MEERNKLIKEIYEYDRMIEKNRTKRMLTILLLYTFVNSILFYVPISAITENMNISQFIICIVIASIYSVISYFANISIFAQLFEKGEQEHNILNGMKKRLQEFDKEHNIEKKFPVEDFFKNRHM